MKTSSKFTIYDLRFTTCRDSARARRVESKSSGGGGGAAGVGGHRKSAIVNRKSTAGIALVITLILLSVTLIMAVAFLAVARRERNAATTSTDTALARLATDAALSAAQAEIMANVLTASSNAYNFDTIVSTNFLPTVPYDPSNIGNILPRAPVFVPTNGGLDFRFYLDLNRNGMDEPNGWVAEVDSTGATNGNTVWVTGDPEWIGVLERPDANPANNNKFIARYAFGAFPIGNALDVNYIHNQAATRTVDSSFSTFASDGYLRNQGVGSWELNLAAFLADMNTNQWALTPLPNNTYYFYKQPGAFNVGHAFEDALSLLSYRYGYNYSTLATANNYFNPTYLTNYPYNIDLYSDGPVQTAEDFSATPPGDNLNNSWAGADNTNRFFALPSDLFDPTKSSVPFTNRLTAAGKGLSTYDRYTFYRLLSQLGTDSTADDGRMNLNFDNLDPSGAVMPGSETNLIAWTALRFFTNAANRLLTNATTIWLKADATSYAQTFQTNTAFGITNIPVYINGQFVYSPAVNRLLQVAANMYDAANSSPWPSVFRPVFTSVQNGANRDLFISGYEQVVLGGAIPFLAPPIDASALVNLAPSSGIQTNVYGVPWILGAKKGLPNFNQFYMFSAVEVTRKLKITKPYFGAQPNTFVTNQMYLFSISNQLGCSFWNSYTNNYTNGPITIVARDVITMTVTNDAPGFVAPIISNYFAINTNVVLTTWPRTAWQGSPPSTVLDPTNGSFLSFNATATLLASPSIYRYGGYISPGAAPIFDPYNNDYQTNVSTPQLPHFGLQTTNRLQVFILAGNHVIDYAHFAGPEGGLDITTNLADPDYSSSGDMPAYMWSTNGGSPSAGELNQIYVSQQLGPPPPSAGGKWESPPNLPAGVPATPEGEKAFFTGFLDYNKAQYGVYVFNGRHYTNTSLSVQVPYTPTRIVYNYTSWQANDPLVHYLASDLAYSNPGITGIQKTDNLLMGLPAIPAQITDVNKRYSPWGLAYPYPNANNSVDATWQMQLKDPLAWRSDNWDFPANPYPTVGWLGRVHRGTPWQTVYLKASSILAANNGPSSWSQWTGNGNTFDAANAAPLADATLFDLFTTAPDANATHGTLSVNQSGLAAWSAVFSGIVAMTNTTAAPALNVVPTAAPWIINPAGLDGANSAIANIVNSLNTTRGSFNNGDGVVGSFEHIGNILRAPLLTEQSPFLHWADAGVINTAQQQYGISDELYEWLPQQMLGLVRVPSTPRYVIYCYGQTLHPAVNGLVTAAGASFGMITNYQIVAESAARAVVRVDKHVTGNSTNYTTVVESFNVLPPP